MDPHAAFLVNRGFNTIGVRMEQHCVNARKFANYLVNCKYVKKVNYPGLENTFGHAVAKKQMSDFGGMISFETKLTFEQTKKFVNNLKAWILELV